MILDLAKPREISAIRIDWAAPYATHFVVQYFTGEDGIRKPTSGVWEAFPGGAITDGKGGTACCNWRPRRSPRNTFAF